MENLIKTRNKKELMTRNPSVAGSFYPAYPNDLKDEIKSSFNNKLGPGKPTIKETKIKAAIVPHAGYSYSGPCAAHVYEALKHDKNKTFIILGTDHVGNGTSISDEDWQTPLGIAKTNEDLIEELKKSIKVNNQAHQSEHSIEVQIPFLQYIKENNITLVPITIGNDANINEIAHTLSELKHIWKKDFCIIASSDLTHYGINYNFMPFKENIKQNLYRLDKKAIDAILNLDSTKFISIAEKSTICGYKPIAVLIEYARLTNLKPKLLKYYTSGDINEDYSSCVGYASLIFE